ncbi:MAG: sulfatase-like hydrolase/transferase [Bacteroidales bacterium]|nr:sulfatase-like hydrolase/transferase [Bacteroidales bacterium]MCF8391817.1 sulfatase-like hydrolase/transferase [Bacteroidales bacterium]
MINIRNIYRPEFFAVLLASLFTVSCSGHKNKNTQKPNILFIFIDDMGYGDLGCYGNNDVHSPHIDQLAAEGIRFNQFYVNSPICSPSRVAVTTGQFPSRWGITSYISSRDDNEERGIKDYLDLSAPSVARDLQNAGYYTAHIGKWHMGGGRDVNDAPLIREYGFNESVTQFEGLGERYLATYETLNRKDSTRSLERRSAALGIGPVHWAKREDFTQIFVDRTIEAIENASKAEKPFYINLWPDDIHTPLEPPLELRGDLSTKARFLGVMEEMDKQMGRLFDYIRSNHSLMENTLIVFTSDNGPDYEVNVAGHLRGVKTELYEGGFREPFIVWWPSVIPEKLEGSVNDATVMAGIDLPLTFRAIAGLSIADSIDFDGENMLDAISGKAAITRTKSLFWMRPPDRPGINGQNAPDLAIRKGEYKLLMDFDGSNLQLYNIISDDAEKNNLVNTLPEVADDLKKDLAGWYEFYPHSVDKAKIMSVN